MFLHTFLTLHIIILNTPSNRNHDKRTSPECFAKIIELNLNLLHQKDTTQNNFPLLQKKISKVLLPVVCCLYPTRTSHRVFVMLFTSKLGSYTLFSGDQRQTNSFHQNTRVARLNSSTKYRVF